MSRCYSCDELIFADRYAQAGADFYHKDHLRCFHCDQQLDDSKGFDKDGQLYCMQCYEDKFSDDCDKCGKRITLDSRHITYEENSGIIPASHAKSAKKLSQTSKITRASSIVSNATMLTSHPGAAPVSKYSKVT
ncbi:four and a half LIM domains protein 3 [Caerostris extrusa]|uniref:Four and a half LIM domains protein 3 n=1 Tax=Caerostris extrusa TaxID=172846 RepID=A0AAV4QSF3_CAEEX|nr:four and a half LIM domains protein 3 [Caerostris extrusa]